MSELLKTQKGQLGAAAVALLVILAAGWFLGVSPQKKKAADLETQTNAAATELAQKRAALEHPAADVNIRASDGYLLKAALPDAVDMPRAILDIERLARKNGLELSSLKPSPGVPGTGYSSQPIGLVVQGGFAKVARFLGQLRGSVRVENRRLLAQGPIYSISTVSIGAPSAPATFPVVKATVNINAYAFAAPAPGTTPAPTTPSSTASVAAGATP